MKTFEKVAAFLGRFGEPTEAGKLSNPRISWKLMKKAMRGPTHKAAFSMGYRGTPRLDRPPGSVPAPTIDQVRRREIKYGQKIHVKNGLMFFASDGMMWTREEAQARWEATHCGA